MKRGNISHLVLLLILYSCSNSNSSSREAETGLSITEAVKQKEGELIGNPLQTFDEYSDEDSTWRSEFEPVESLTVDFNKDGVLDEIELSRIFLFKKIDGTSFFYNEDPGDYHSIKITDGKTKKEFAFFNGDGWIKNYYLGRLSQENQEFRSDYFVNYSSGKNHLLIFEGFTYGSGSSTRTIINFYDGEPTLVFNADKKIKAINNTYEGLSIVINEAAAEEKSAADEENVYRVDKWLHLINQ